MIYPKFYSNPCYYNTNINFNDPIKTWFTRIVFDQIDPISGLILLIFSKLHILNFMYERVIIAIRKKTKTNDLLIRKVATIAGIIKDKVYSSDC